MKNKKKLVIVFVISILLLTGGITLFFLLKPDFQIKGFNDKLTINYNSKFKNSPGDVCYGNKFICNKVKIKVEGKVHTNKIGKYKIKYSYIYNGKKYVLNQIIEVNDIEAPKLEIEDKEVRVCPNGKIQNFKYKVTDNFDKDIDKNIKKTFDKKNKKVVIEVTDSSKNKTVKEINAIIEDKISPVITLNGSENLYFTQGFRYNDEGAKVIDNCDDDIKIEEDGEVDSNTPGTYYITYSAKDSSGNISSIKRTITIKSTDSDYRIVYLTFDDGPSTYTGELLDILKKYNVKATFFVTGNGSDDMILREYNEGHKIALHTNTHDYSYVYSSINNYFSDLYAIQDRVKRITGEAPNIIRFPGGSSNTVSMNYDGGIGIMSKLVYEVEVRGFHYFDWNISSGDGGSEISSDQVYNNVISNLKEETSIVLQHDTKKYSIDAVERIIKYCQANGYTFKTLSETTYGAHHGVNN